MSVLCFDLRNAWIIQFSLSDFWILPSFINNLCLIPESLLRRRWEMSWFLALQDNSSIFGIYCHICLLPCRNWWSEDPVRTLRLRSAKISKYDEMSVSTSLASKSHKGDGEDMMFLWNQKNREKVKKQTLFSTLRFSRSSTLYNHAYFHKNSVLLAMLIYNICIYMRCQFFITHAKSICFEMTANFCLHTFALASLQVVAIALFFCCCYRGEENDWNQRQ